MRSAAEAGETIRADMRFERDSRPEGSEAMDATRRFYDDLADQYPLLFGDWHATVEWQAGVLDRLIRDYRDAPRLSVLDCTCGVGTQAIGLALRGYTVHATDLSSEAVARAGRAADEMDARLTFAVADVRALTATVRGRFDVVLSCDNALPHLIAPDDLRLAARQMWATLADDGLLVVSIRDYDTLLDGRPRAELPRVFDRPAGRQIAFQVWDWDEAAPLYTVHQFIVHEADGMWTTRHYQARYRALRRDELTTVLDEAGFVGMRWHEPAESGYYQPIVTARRG